MTRMRVLLAALVILALPASVWAVKIPLTAKITGDQEVPPVASNSLGVASLEYDTVTDMLTGNILILDLLLASPETAAHIHGPAPVGVNAGVLVGLPLGDLKPVSIKVSDYGSAADLLNELWYINVHNVVYPNGEIRGQIEVVPEPGAIVLAALGLIGLIGFTIRRRG